MVTESDGDDKAKIYREEVIKTEQKFLYNIAHRFDVYLGMEVVIMSTAPGKTILGR